MIRAAIVDTNVVVAGLITGRADSPVVRVLNGMLAASFPFVISTALLEEYRAVISRAELRRLHGLGSADIETLSLGRRRAKMLANDDRCGG